MITAAVLVILGSLTAFNVKMKQIYLTGSYKSRFNGMDFKAMKGVENLDIRNANKLGIQIEQGEKEGIWIRGDVKDKYTVDFQQHTLTLDVSKRAKEEGDDLWGDIVIITKTLKQVTTSPYLTAKENPTDHVGNVDLKGYHLNHLNLRIGLGAAVSLNKMEMDTLNAVVGDKQSVNASLYIASDTKINAAILNVPGKSLLTLANPTITKAVYNLSDSATVSLNGKLVKMIR